MKVQVALALSGLICAAVANSDRHHGPRSLSEEARKRNKDVADTENKAYWEQHGLEEIEHSLGVIRNWAIAKNVIIFVGDGMSVATLTGARIYKAQTFMGNTETPESEYLTFERFPFMGHSKTFDIDRQVADSASTASAMFSGIKTIYYTLGYDNTIDHSNIDSMRSANEMSTVLSWAQEAGMDTGFVTTARVTHATPAALYAHTYDRFWECGSEFEDGDGSVPPGDLYDIAWQLVHNEPSKRAKVIMGGGYNALVPQFLADEASETRKMENLANGRDLKSINDWDGHRTDGVDLIEMWEEDHPNSAVVKSMRQLEEVDVNEIDHLFGLFGTGHMEFEDERIEGRDPSLSNMTRKAIQMLSKNTGGFFLMVEGGRIDHAHHDSTGTRALSETVAMDKAVEAAIEELGANLNETLIIVTADHGHAYSLSGYAARGEDIRGFAQTDGYSDDLPNTIQNYANGGHFYYHNQVDQAGNIVRRDMTNDEYTAFDYMQPNSGPEDFETHGGDDVAIFAQGPMAHLFHTTHDQSYIAYVMAYSACIGPYKDDHIRCEEGRGYSGATSIGVSFLSIVLAVLVARLQ